MGILRCSRKNCKAVMCDRHSKEHGYICNECFEELCEVWKNRGTVEEFLENSKQTSSEQVDFYKIYSGIFQLSV